MAGTTAGGEAARETNYKKYGQTFYKDIGALGGRVKVKKGWGSNPELAKRAGAIGGSKSRRGLPLAKQAELQKAAEAVKREQDDDNRSMLSRLARKYRGKR